MSSYSCTVASDLLIVGNRYVNFATGDETQEQIYGGRERLDKLRRLKEKWDPEGVFGFYNPIR